MNSNKSDKFLRFGLIIVGLLVIVAGSVYMGVNLVVFPTPTVEVAIPVVTTPPPTFTPTPTGTATPTPTRPKPTPTPTSAVPLGGIVYALSPDINSVGWVQADENGNHFGESFLYTGLRNGVLYHGAMQFDLSFIPKGSTIFMAELELTGLLNEGLTPDSAFAVSLLSEESNADWSKHNYEIIHNAAVEIALAPLLEADSLAIGQANKLTFNAAQRSIVEERIESKLLSLRIDSLNPDQESWFAWDSGYGEQTQGHGPVLRLGVLPPLPTATPTPELSLAEAELTNGTGEGEVIEEDITPEVQGTLVMITSTPTPENLQTVAAIAAVATFQATATGTATPVPLNWVTPLVVTATPTPENTATALFQSAEATAAVIAFGTSTPTPPNLVTATPTPTETSTPIFILLEGELPPATPVPVPTIVAQFIPTPLIGKIAFKSDRGGAEQFYVINPDGSQLALLTNCWAYALAEQADVYSSDGRFRVFTKDTIRYRNIDDPVTGETTGAAREDAPALYWYDSLYKVEQQLTQFGSGIAYGGVWSPIGQQIAFISTESQNDEIWVANSDGSGLLQLTRDEFAWWDKHPSWSPDGQHIVFWSNRTGHGQIFVMNADGSNLYSLSRTGFNDYDPVWIKYPGIPQFDPESTDGKPTYQGSLGFCGSEGNCGAFGSQTEAQAFFLKANGGQLTLDPYGLDSDHDGLACETAP